MATHTYIHEAIQAYILTYTHTYIHTDWGTDTHTHIQAGIHKHTYTCRHSYIHTYRETFGHACIPYTHTDTATYRDTLHTMSCI